MAVKKKSSPTGMKTVFPLRLDAATMARLAALQKRWLPPNYGGVHQGPVPTISMADLMRFVVTIGIDGAEQMLGPASKGGKGGTR